MTASRGEVEWTPEQGKAVLVHYGIPDGPVGVWRIEDDTPVSYYLPGPVGDRWKAAGQALFDLRGSQVPWEEFLRGLAGLLPYFDQYFLAEADPATPLAEILDRARSFRDTATGDTAASSR